MVLIYCGFIKVQMVYYHKKYVVLKLFVYDFKKLLFFGQWGWLWEHLNSKGNAAEISLFHQFYEFKTAEYNMVSTLSSHLV